MRPPAWILAAVVALGACTVSRDGPEPSPPVSTPPVSTSAPTASPEPSPTAEPSPPVDDDVELPSDLEPFVDDPASVEAVAGGDRGPLVPPGASYGSFPDGTWDPLDQIVVSWFDGVPGDRRLGVVVWQRFEEPPAWRAVYAFSDPRREGVFGVRVVDGDLTGDGIPDALSFEDRGGTGGCGTYRVIRSLPGDAEEVFRRDVCDTEIRIAGGDLEIVSAVYELDDAHCCPSAFRTTTMRWDGEGWERVTSVLEPTQPA